LHTLHTQYTCNIRLKEYPQNIDHTRPQQGSTDNN